MIIMTTLDVQQKSKTINRITCVTIAAERFSSLSNNGRSWRMQTRQLPCRIT